MQSKLLLTDELCNKTTIRSYEVVLWKLPVLAKSNSQKYLNEIFNNQVQAKLNVFMVSIGLHGNELCIMPYILNLNFEFLPITTS